MGEQHLPVAIIGMGLRLPGAIEDGPALTRALAKGQTLIGPLPEHRAVLFPEIPDDVPLFGAYLEEVSRFDAGFFGINGLEARSMDPQQRHLLEVSWQALENAALNPAQLRGQSVGVFVGTHSQDYQELAIRAGVDVNAYWNSSSNASILANRLSYFYDFTGPSLSLNTACASGLEALAQGVHALRESRCQLAMVAGVNLILTATISASAARAGMLSPNGTCRPFDQAANGFVRGEGIVALILKPLDKALADGDPIHAVIRHVVSAHGGHANSLTSPNYKRQRDLILRCWREAAVDPGAISLMEAHGTGTRLGDSIEVEALKDALAELQAGNPNQDVKLTTVKSFFGHQEAAAGLVAVIRICMEMKSGLIAPNPGFQKLSPLIDLNNSPLKVMDQPQPWHENDGAFAGVSSFGFGGAMVHLVLERVQDQRPQAPTLPQSLFLFLSARNQESLQAYARRLQQFLQTPSGQSLDLADVCHTFLTGRQHLKSRGAIAFNSPVQLSQALQAIAEASPLPAQVYDGHQAPPQDPSLSQVANWTRGAPIQLKSMGRRLSLPCYPFSGKHHWY